MGKKIEKSKLSRILPYYFRYKGFLFGYSFLYLINGLINLLPAIIIADIIMQITQSQFNLMVGSLKKLALVYFLYVALSIIVNHIGLRLTQKVANDLSSDMTKSFLNIRLPDFFAKQESFMVLLTENITALSSVGTNFLKNVLTIVNSILQIIVIILICPYYSIWLLITAAAMIGLTHIKNSSFSKTFPYVIKENDNNMKIMSEIVGGLKEIKDLNLKDVIMDKVKQQTTNNSDVKMSHELTQEMCNQSMSTLLNLFTSAIFYAISAVALLTEKLTLGNFFIVGNYNCCVLNLINSIIETSRIISQNQALAERVFGVIDFKHFNKEIFGKEKIIDIQGEIEFNNVKFGYNKDELLFKNFNLHIDKNNMTSFVGKSGEGKSTILNLITKDFYATGGNIYIDGIDVNRFDEKSLKNCISIVSQSPYVFDGTIKENLQMVNPKATDKEIIRACKQAQIYDIIMAKPKKFETKVGSSGATLSGGQRQRLAIARALLKKSKIIIFDEATSALDNESQEKIKQIISELSKDHTILMVAHRLNTVIDSDKIVLIDNHEIIAEGSHSELLSNCEIYQELYAASDENNTSKSLSPVNDSVCLSIKQNQNTTNLYKNAHFASRHQKQIESLQVISPPDKTEYFINEPFEPKGLKILINYTDGSSTVSEIDNLSNPIIVQNKTNSINIRYGAYLICVPIVVKKTVPEEIIIREI